VGNIIKPGSDGTRKMNTNEKSAVVRAILFENDLKKITITRSNSIYWSMDFEYVLDDIDGISEIRVDDVMSLVDYFVTNRDIEVRFV
jgi:hypothetical protein